MSLDGFGQSRFESCSVTVNENERTGSVGDVSEPRGLADWPRGASHRRIEPCVRFSRTRLSDILHREAFALP